MGHDHDHHSAASRLHSRGNVVARWLTKNSDSRNRITDRGWCCSAGVSPAILLIPTKCKNAGGTPALQKTCIPSPIRWIAFLPRGFGLGSSQVCQESVVHACERAPAEDDSADGARGLIVGDADVAAASALFDGHFRNDGDAHAGANHAEDAAELAALEDDLRIDPGAV